LPRVKEAHILPVNIVRREIDDIGLTSTRFPKQPKIEFLNAIV
jgi:hypothetical protein